jgi:hypothetical protein
MKRIALGLVLTLLLSSNAYSKNLDVKQKNR